MSNSLLVNDSSCKKRSPNYSDTDKQIFLSIFEKYKNIIENKKTDSIVGMQKKQAWKDVTELYNSNVLQARNSEQLQQLWRNLKKKAKDHSSSRRRSHFQTGGGAYKDVQDPILDQVEGMFFYNIMFIYQRWSPRGRFGLKDTF